MSEENPIDTVNLEIPLLIRLFEYSREDATSDQDLHVVAENLLKCSQEMEGKPLSMSCYDKVVPSKEDVKESAGDTLDKFEKNLYKAVEEANKGEWNLFKHAAQVASMMGKRMAKDINHKRFSNTVSLVDSASVQPDKGDAKYYIDLAKKQYVLFKSEYSKKESTVAGDIAQKDVSLFRGKDKIAKIKSVAEAVTAVLEKNLSGDISDKLKNAENLDPKKLQNLAAKYDLDISMEVRGREVEFTIDGSVGGREDLNHLGSLLRDLVGGRNFFYNYGLKKSKVQVVF